MKPFRFYTLLFGSLVFILNSCSSNDYEVNLDEVPIKVNFINLDSLISSSTWPERDKKFMVLKKGDKALFEYAFSYAIEVSLSSDSSFRNGLDRFYSNPYIASLEKAIQQRKRWRDTSSLFMLNGFKRLSYFLPTWKKPRNIYFINSRFASSAFCTDYSIAIGQERYLGSNHPLIKALPSSQFYGWIKEAMEPRFVCSDALLVWMSTHGIPETSENFACEMIRWGKLLFLAHICLPEQSEAEILRYSPKDFEWALASEKSIWQYLVDEELLFKTDEETRMNFLHEGPFTIGLPKESPDRLGRFMGYQIVKQFMENTGVSPAELIHTPYNKILQKYQVQS